MPSASAETAASSATGRSEVPAQTTSDAAACTAAQVGVDAAADNCARCFVEDRVRQDFADCVKCLPGRPCNQQIVPTPDDTFSN